MKPKILFTTTWGPYPKLSFKKDPYDFFNYRNTYKQKMFQLKSFQSWHSLHLMAQNIAIPSVVMENPIKQVFQKEVNQGNYEIIAITFTVIMTNEVLEMIEWIKSSDPKIEIVLGGYGTAVFKESFEISEKLKNLVDYICYGEGINFLNTIIFNKWGIKVNKVLKQDFIPINNYYCLSTTSKLFNNIIISHW